MDKFGPVRMQDLVRVVDPDSGGGVTLVFAGGAELRVRAEGGRLVSEVHAAAGDRPA